MRFCGNESIMSLDLKICNPKSLKRKLGESGRWGTQAHLRPHYVAGAFFGLPRSFLRLGWHVLHRNIVSISEAIWIVR